MNRIQCVYDLLDGCSFGSLQLKIRLIFVFIYLRYFLFALLFSLELSFAGMD